MIPIEASKVDMPVDDDDDRAARLVGLQQAFKEAANEVPDLDNHGLRKFTDPTRYQREVLPIELEELRRKAPCPFHRPKLLVLLCGTVPPPLLLSIAYTEPEQVLLVGSDSPDGRKTVEAVLQHLPAPQALDPEHIHPNDPAQAYEHLVGRLSKELVSRTREEMLMDLTGGKKTMTMAAFMAASQLGLRTIYVDGDYEARLRLPKPGTSSISVVEDPSVVFWLRERKEALRLFDEGGYKPAARLMKRIGEGLKQGGRRAEAESVLKASIRVDAVALWEEAFYPEALQALKGIGVQAPRRLEELSKIWGHDNPERLWRLARNHKGEGVLRFAADRVAWGQREYERRHLRRSFLFAYMACDSALEAIRYHENPRERCPIKKASPKETDLREKHFREFAEGEAMRNHRNALVHRIASPEKAHVDRLLKDNAKLCFELLKAVGAAIGCTNTADILRDPLEGIDALRPSELENA